MDLFAIGTSDGHLEIIGVVVTSLFAILTFILRHIFTKVMPRQAEHYKEALASSQDTFERVLTAQGDIFRSGLQSLGARQRKTSENVSKLIEQIQSHEQREELQLEQQTGHLARIKDAIERIADKP